MDAAEFLKIIDDIEYKPGWSVYIGFDGRWYLQIICSDSLCADTMEPAEWKSGKRYLSEHMCRQEIIGVVFDLIKSAEDHEMREFFKYRGRAIYCPHIDPDVLHSIATKDNMNVRKNPMTMEEPA